MNTPATIKKMELIRSEATSGSMVTTTAIREFVQLKTELEAEIKATWKALQAYMVENDIKDLDVLTIAQKPSWKATQPLPPRFYKQVLDTKLLTFMYEHGDKLPKNVTRTTSPYLTKTNRKVEA